MLQLLNNKLVTANQRSKFSYRNRVEINNESQGLHNVRKQIKLNISMARSHLCDCSSKYMNIKRAITVPNTGTAAAPNKKK